MFKRKKNADAGTPMPENQPEKKSPASISKSLKHNIELIKDLFKDDDTIIFRRFENNQNPDICGCIIFVSEMVENIIINDAIIKPLISSSIKNGGNLPDTIMLRTLTSDQIEKTSDISELTEAIVRGDTVLLLEGYEDALVIDSKGWKTRNITEPESEKVIHGPKEGFTESLLMNLSMVRRRLATNKLKFKFRVIGVQSKTKVCICYIDGIASNQIVKELNKRLDGIDIDGLTCAGTIQELIKDAPFSPLKTIGNTERPDVVAANLLEGRIAVIIDGSPIALTLPYLFIENFQANEDYYINFYFSSINRLLRFLSFILTISLPAVYIALTTFHQEMIPTPLVRNISAARQDVPFPTVVEVTSLLITFELLRESGTRMPTNVGQALSIVGALVLGQAAVDARFVSAPVVIIVALTAITGLAMPRFKGIEVIMRFLLILFASFIGLYGYIFGIIGLLIHLFTLRSFGVPYMFTFMNFTAQDAKDTLIRPPWMFMKYRPKFIAPVNRRRKSSGGKKQ